MFFQVRSIKDLIVILNYFNKHSLITQKLADFLLIKQTLELIQSKNHLTPEGLQILVELKSSINIGLFEGLKRF